MTEFFMPEGYYIGSRTNSEYVSCAEGLKRAKENGVTLEARAVMCDSRHDLIVDLGKMRGIIPREEPVSESRFASRSWRSLKMKMVLLRFCHEDLLRKNAMKTI